MVAIDINTFAEENWSGYKKSVTDISKSKDASLVENDMELYCFDDICANLYDQDKKPTSADAFIIDGKNIELVEFKSGFKNKLTKKNFDKERGKCPKTQEICEDYWKLFFDKRKKEVDELILNIRIKAVESYITLEKHIFPSCPPSEIPMSLKFLVVIDEDGVDGMEDTLAELAGAKKVKNNPYTSIRKSLRRLVACRDKDGNQYFYDNVEVLSVMDFQNHLRLLKN